VLQPEVGVEFEASLAANPRQSLEAVDSTGFARLVHDGESALPDTCTKWKALKLRGFLPSNALARQTDAGAVVRCGVLEFLLRASPSRISYVRTALDGAGPDTLPAIIGTATSQSALAARRTAEGQGMRLSQVEPDAHIGKSGLPGRVVILEPKSVTSITLNAEAWGDVNGDGIEDVLVSVLNAADNGSFFDMRVIVLTRLAPTSSLTVIGNTR
jgi:hypothetical protein